MAKAEPSAMVFVVDDDASVRRGLARLLVSAGYAVETFSSAGDFLAHARSRDICGCVVLDMRMPGGIGGLEVTRSLRQTDQNLKIIIMSQHDPAHLLPRAMEAGANACIDKTLMAFDLIRMIKSAISCST